MGVREIISVEFSTSMASESHQHDLIYRPKGSTYFHSREISTDYDKSDWLSGRDLIPRAAAELQAQQFGADRA